MIIKPKVRGFICTTTHPTGCAANVAAQIAYVQAQGALEHGPKKVLVIGASTGYGLASRINAAFGSGAATIGVFYEKAGTEVKTATAGWYNAAAFDHAAKKSGLYAKSINGDAFSNECRDAAIKLIKADLGEIDLVVYSLASPVRKMPDSGALVRSALKPIGAPYKAITVDTNKNLLVEVEVAPANAQEITDTVTVMGGQDWELWMAALEQAGVLAKGAQAVAYSYIGTQLTWPIYWHGTLGKAKEDLERAAHAIDEKMALNGGHAYVAVLKSVVTQASSAIPVMPLYISAAFKVMKEQGIHEDCIEQVQRLFARDLFSGQLPETDAQQRLRLDDWELRDAVQDACGEILAKVTDETLEQLTDYQGYKAAFLRLFGFGIEGIDYEAEVDPVVDFEVIELGLP